MPSPDYLIEKQILAEDKAEFVSYEDNPMLFRRQVKRRWTRIRDDEVASCLDYLNVHGTATNGTNVPQMFVDDPQISRSTPTPQTLPHDALGPGGLPTGRWRVVSNEKDTSYNSSQEEGLQGIVQTLRYGAAREIDWTECRIVQNKSSLGNTEAAGAIANTTSDSPEQYLTIEFVNLDPAWVGEMVLALHTAALTSPAANPGCFEVTDLPITTYGIPGFRTNVDSAINPPDNDEYEGFWHLISVTAGEGELQDGSGVIRVILARPQYTLNAYRTVISLFNSTSRKEAVTYLWNVPKNIAQDILDAFEANGKSATASYSDDNMVDLVLTQFIFDPDSPLTVATSESSVNCSHNESQIFFWGVGTPLANPYRLEDVANYGVAGYTVMRTMRLDKETGLFDLVFTTRFTTARTVALRNSYVANLEERQRRIDSGVLFINLPALTDPPVQGIIETQTLRLNDDCTYDADTTEITSTPEEQAYTWVVNGGTASATTYRNQRTIPTTDIAAMPAGNSNSVDVSINQDGTFDVQIVSRPVKASGGNPADDNPPVVTERFSYATYHKLTVTSDDDEGVVRAYMVEGWMHVVSYHATEIEAYHELSLGYHIGSGTGVSVRGGLYRTNKVVGFNIETVNTVPATTGIEADIWKTPAGGTWALNPIVTNQMALGTGSVTIGDFPDTAFPRPPVWTPTP